MFRYLLAVLLFLSPILFIVGTFFYYDPYMLRGVRVEELTQFGNVALNSDMLSTENYLRNREQQKYNTFVIGSSTAEAFLFEYWTPFLKGRISPFMYTHKGGGGLDGIYEKVKFIDKQGDSLNNVLIVLNRYSLVGETLGEGEWARVHDPRLSMTSMRWKSFRSTMTTYFSKGLFIRYLYYKYTGQKKPFMDVFLRAYPGFRTDNQNIRIMAIEEDIAKDSLGFYNLTKRERFAHRNSTKTGESKAGMNTEKRDILAQMTQIFQKHHTHFRIVVMPMYDQVRMNTEDVKAIKEIAGSENVFDFSNDKNISASLYNYDDESHLRPKVANQLIQRMYRNP